MRHYHEKRAGSIILFSAVIFAFASFLSPPLAAQQAGKGDPLSAAERMRQRQIKLNNQMETTLMISELEKESRRPVKDDLPRLDYVQLKEDFWHLQTVNNRMMLTAFSNKVLDYKHISEASGEIRKRAVRLKSNLLLPGKDERAAIDLKGSTELDEGEVKTALLALDDLIMTFVNNPIFQHPEVVDVQQSAKARRDLDAIIKLSGKIKKSAGRLVKNAPK